MRKQHLLSIIRQNSFRNRSKSVARFFLNGNAAPATVQSRILQMLNKYKKQHKAQLSYVLLVAIIVFALIVLTISMLKPKVGPVDYTDPSSTKVFIERCIEDTARFAIFRMGLQGGYLKLPGEHATLAHLDVAYAFKDGNKLVTIQQMEYQLAEFIDAHVLECIDNSIAIFEERFGKISYTLPKTKTAIQHEDIRFEVDFPIEIRTEEGTVRYDRPYTDIRIPVRLSKIHQEITNIVQEYISTGHLLKLECTLDKDFAIHGTSFGKDNLFVIEDSKSVLRNSPDRNKESFRFFFVIQDQE